MIIEKRTIAVERRLSDYCKGCNFFTPDIVEFCRVNGETGNLEVHQLETCVHGNLCDALYLRVRGEANAGKE